MTFTVQTQERRILGTVAVAGSTVSFVGERDGEFEQKIQAYARDGVRELRDIYDAEADKRVLVERTVLSNDPSFAPALRDQLVREGLLVTERDTMVEREIRGLLGSYADEEDRQKLLIQLPHMTVLEQSMLLQTLRRGVR